MRTISSTFSYVLFRRLHFPITQRLSTVGRLFIILLIGVYFSSCSRDETTIIIKTGVQSFSNFIDGETSDAYTLLKKAAADFSSIYKKKKVTIRVIQYEAARRKEELDNSFGTDNSPDIIFASQFNLSTYIHKGNLVSLDDIITPEIRSDIKDDYWDNCIVDNKTYMIPYVTMQNVMCYNRDLFRMCGLNEYCGDDTKGVVQTWTLSEWDRILDVLKEKLPENHYPAMMYAADDQGDTHIMMLLRSRGGRFFNKEGRVSLEGAFPVMQWIRDMARGGYFPPHCENLTITDNSELFMTGQLAIYISNAAIQNYLNGTGIDCGYMNYPSVEKNGMCTSFDMSFGIVDNDDEGKLEVAKDFVKYIYESKWLDYSAACIPVSNRIAKKYETELKGVQMYLNNKARNVNYTLNSPNWLGVRSVFYKYIGELIAGKRSIDVISNELEDALNTQLDKGRVTSHPHE